MSSKPDDRLAAMVRDWNEDRSLSPFENLMWRTEVNPMLRSTGVVLELLGHAPDRERVVAAHDWGSRLLAPLRHRVVEDPLGLAAPRWVVDSDFDLGYHLRFVRLTDPGSVEQVLGLAQSLAMAPFDRARPLWEAVMVDGLADGRAAYVLKLHHCIADGQGVVQMLEMLHGESAERGRARPLPVPAPENVSGTSLALKALLKAPRWAMRETVRTGLRVVTEAERTVVRPARLIEAARYAQSLGRMLGPPPAPGSVLLEQRSLGRRFKVLELPLADLREAGRNAGGTVNDAFLAGITAGLRLYHEHHGVSAEELTVAFPISLRQPDDPPGSNRFAGARILAPIAERDPAERIRLIGERTREARSEPAIGFMDALSPVLTRLPAQVAATMTERVTRTIDLQASNIRGPGRVGYLAGARVQRTFAFGAAPGPAVMVTLMSYDDVCCVALTINAAAAPDHGRLLDCMAEGLAEVTGRPVVIPEVARDAETTMSR